MAVTAAIGLGLGAAQAIYGAVKQRQANKAAKNDIRPVYSALPEDNSDINIAESQANQGMGAGARQALLNNSQNNLASTTNAILMGGGDANSIANAVNNSQQGLNNLAIYDDQARQQHLSTLMSAYRQRAALRQANADKEFQFNKYAPWTDRQKRYAQQAAAGQQLFMSGLSSFGKGIGGLAGAMGGGGDMSGGGASDGSGGMGGGFGGGDGGYSSIGSGGGTASIVGGEEYPTTHQPMYVPSNNNYWSSGG